MGFVYLATNENMPDLVKIGSTNSSVQKRMDELYNTSAPGRFVCPCYCKAENPQGVERKLHDLFDYCRVDKKREFFRVDWLSAAVALVMLTESEHEGRVRVLAGFVRGPEDQADADESTKTLTSDETAMNERTDMDARRERYMRYVAERVKNPHIVPVTYDSALSHLSEKHLNRRSVYSITNFDEAGAIYRRLLSGGNLHTANIKYQNRAMSAAMGKYMEFLASSLSASSPKQIESSDAKSRRDAYVEYVRQNIRIQTKGISQAEAEKLKIKRANECATHLDDFAKRLGIASMYEVDSDKEAEKYKGKLPKTNKGKVSSIRWAMGHYVKFLKQSK